MNLKLRGYSARVMKELFFPYVSLRVAATADAAIEANLRHATISAELV